MADPKRKLFQTLKNKQIHDIGFGANSNASTERLINKDGSFNVERKGLSIQAPYRMLVYMSWKRFFIVIFFGYILVNGFFALLFTMIGPDSFSGINAGPFYKVFTEAFFFSTQTFTTLGYGVVRKKYDVLNFY